MIEPVNKEKNLFRKGTPRFHKWYDYYYCIKIKKRNIEKFFGNGTFFHERNIELVEIMKTIPNISKIFEFACTYGFLALEITKNIKFNKYVISNFLEEVIEYMKKQNLEEKGIEIRLFDANEIPVTNLEEFDTFICTAVEHLEKDIEIISSLPKKSNFLFSVPNIEDPTHFRIFNNEEEIYNRYKDILDIISIKCLQKEHMKKFVVYAKIKEN